MGDDRRKWNCQNCGRTNKTVPAPNGLVNCEFCTAVMTIEQGRRKAGEILRRWTANRLSMAGRQLRARVAFEDPLAGDGRRLGLVAVAAKLTAIKRTAAR
jgi:hypothetical protein